MDRKTELGETIKKARNELWGITAAEDQIALVPLVGRCFKFRNDYGSGDKWWLYSRVLSASNGALTVFSFEKSSCDIIEIHPRKVRSDMPRNYKEIKEEEFKKAWKKLLDELKTYEGER